MEIINKQNYWIDAGSPDKILQASKLIESIEKRKKKIYRISGNNCIEKKIYNNKKFYKID